MEMLRKLMEYDIECNKDIISDLERDPKTDRDFVDGFKDRVITANTILTKEDMDVDLTKQEEEFVQTCIDMWILGK